MDYAETIDQLMVLTKNKQRRNLIFRLAFIESFIMFAAFIIAAYLFIQLNSVSLPVSAIDHSVISFEATQSLQMSDIYLAAIILAVCTSSIITFIRIKILNHIIAER